MYVGAAASNPATTSESLRETWRGVYVGSSAGPAGAGGPAARPRSPARMPERPARPPTTRCTGSATPAQVRSFPGSPGTAQIQDRRPSRRRPVLVGAPTACRPGDRRAGPVVTRRLARGRHRAGPRPLPPTGRAAARSPCLREATNRSLRSAKGDLEMWNNYTVGHAELRQDRHAAGRGPAQRLADQGHEHGELRSRVVAGLGDVHRIGDVQVGPPPASGRRQVGRPARDRPPGAPGRRPPRRLTLHTPPRSPRPPSIPTAAASCPARPPHARVRRSPPEAHVLRSAV